MVDNEINQYKNFITQFPHSLFIPEALAEIASHNVYVLQLSLSRDDKIFRLEQIKKIFKGLFTDGYQNAKLSQKAREAYDFISQNEGSLTMPEVDFSLYIKLVEYAKK